VYPKYLERRSVHTSGLQDELTEGAGRSTLGVGSSGNANMDSPDDEDGDMKEVS